MSDRSMRGIATRFTTHSRDWMCNKRLHRRFDVCRGYSRLPYDRRFPVSRNHRSVLPAMLGAMLCMAVMTDTAWAQGELAPEKAQDTLSHLQLRCKIAAFCPYSAEVWDTFRQATDGKPGDQYLLGIYLMTGDK